MTRDFLVPRLQVNFTLAKLGIARTTIDFLPVKDPLEFFT